MLKVIASVLLFVFVFVLSCVVLVKPKHETSDIDRYVWKKGEYRYSYNYKSEISMHINGQTINTDTDIESVLNVKIFDIKENGIEIGLYASPVSVFTNNINDPALEYIYKIPVLAKVSSQGVFMDIKYPENTSEKQRKALLGYYKALEMVIQPDSTYTVTQEDAVGAYEAFYEKTGWNYKKIKTSYVSQNIDKDNFIKTAAVLKNSEFIFEPSVDNIWIDSLSGTELVNYDNEQGEHVVEGAYRFDFNFLDNKAFSGNNYFSGDNFNEATVQFRKRVKVYSDVARKTKKTSAVSAAQSTFQNRLKGLGRDSDRQISLAMRAFLLENPDIISSIPDQIRAGELSDEQAREIINILGIISIPEAQYALVDITEDAGQSDNNRLRAVISFSSVKMPLVNEAKDLLLNRLNGISKSSDSIGLYTSSVLVLGAVSKNLMVDYPLEAEEVADEIKLRIPGSTVMQKKYLLKSLGNTNDENYADAIGDYVDDSDETLRIAAAESLKYMDSDYTESLLADRLMEEDAGKVRYAIVNSLKGRELSENSINAVSSVAKQETDMDTRRALIDVIDQNIEEYPDMLTTLEIMSQKETSEVNLRKIIKAAAKLNK